MLNLGQRYNVAILKASILGVAVNLDTDKLYSRKDAVEELVKIIDEQLEGFVYDKITSSVDRG